MRLIVAQMEGRLSLTLKPDNPFEELMMARVEEWRDLHPGSHSLVDLPHASETVRDLEVSFICGEVKRDGR